MFKKIFSRNRSSIQKMYDEMKKDSNSNQVDSVIWAQMQASALVGNDAKSCVRCRR